MSQQRMSRYAIACSNDSRKAMTLYRLNLKLSQELFTIISCFEVALRNSINNHYTNIHGIEWLKESVDTNGIFSKSSCQGTAKIINRALFPAKPSSTPTIQYNHKYVFNELERINKIRNRIAHHEPVCFSLGNPIIDSTYAKQKYRLIKDLFNWMQIDESALLYGIDHVNQILHKIDDL